MELQLGVFAFYRPQRQEKTKTETKTKTKTKNKKKKKNKNKTKTKTKTKKQNKTKQNKKQNKEKKTKTKTKTSRSLLAVQRFIRVYFHVQTPDNMYTHLTNYGYFDDRKWRRFLNLASTSCDKAIMV